MSKVFKVGDKVIIKISVHEYDFISRNTIQIINRIVFESNERFHQYYILHNNQEYYFYEDEIRDPILLPNYLKNNEL